MFPKRKPKVDQADQKRTWTWRILHELLAYRRLRFKLRAEAACRRAAIPFPKIESTSDLLLVAKTLFSGGHFCNSLQRVRLSSNTIPIVRSSVAREELTFHSGSTSPPEKITAVCNGRAYTCARRDTLRILPTAKSHLARNCTLHQRRIRSMFLHRDFVSAEERPHTRNAVNFDYLCVFFSAENWTLRPPRL